MKAACFTSGLRVRIRKTGGGGSLLRYFVGFAVARASLALVTPPAPFAVLKALVLLFFNFSDYELAIDRFKLRRAKQAASSVLLVKLY